MIANIPFHKITKSTLQKLKRKHQQTKSKDRFQQPIRQIGTSEVAGIASTIGLMRANLVPGKEDDKPKMTTKEKYKECISRQHLLYELEA